jgi:hypothetical protein
VIEMKRSKTILGALVLCVLSLCAFGAVSASAEGLTAFVCTEGKGSPRFSDSHCETESPEGEFTTKAIPAEEATEFTGESVGEVHLKATVALSKVVITCKSTMTESGVIKNIEEGGVMRAHGTNAVQHYTECAASLQSNPEKKCDIENEIGNKNVGTIRTNPVTAITSFNATEHFVTVEPETAGEPFAKFKIIQNAAGTCPATLVGVPNTITGRARGVIPIAKPTHVTVSGTAGGELKDNGGVVEVEATTRGRRKGNEETIAARTS